MDAEWKDVSADQTFYPGMMVMDSNMKIYLVGDLVAEPEGSKILHNKGCGCCAGDYGTSLYVDDAPLIKYKILERKQN